MFDYKNKEYTLLLLVIKGSGPALLGRNWLGQIKLNCHKIFNTSVAINPLDNLVPKYSKVFRSELGTMTQYKAKLTLKEGAKPRYWRPRPVPVALKDVIEKELDSLQSAGIIEPVVYSEWATPIVLIPKKNGRI